MNNYKAITIDGEWVYGQYYYDLDEGHVIVETKHYSGNGVDEDKSDYQEHIRVIPETVCRSTPFVDDVNVNIFQGDTVEFKDFRGVYDSKQSKNDGYIRGWVGFIEWSDYNGWHLNKENEHNESMLKPIGKELDKRDNIYIYSNSNIEKTKPIITGNIHDKHLKK